MWVISQNKCRKLLTASIERCKVLSCGLKRKTVTNQALLTYCMETFGVSEDNMAKILLRNPRLEAADITHVSEALEVLKTFNIDKMAALNSPKVLIPNATSLNFHGKILKECGFTQILPEHLIVYRALVKSKIRDLKSLGMIPCRLDVHRKLLECFQRWPPALHPHKLVSDHDTLFEARLKMLQKYLEFRVNMTLEEFQKAIKMYNRFRHKPLSYHEQSINIAHEELNISLERIRTDVSLIAANPDNTRLILEKAGDFNGVSAKEFIKKHPTILKADYKYILRIQEIFQKYGFTLAAQKRGHLLYTLKPETVEQRILELQQMPYYQSLQFNKRLLVMVVARNKVMKRLDKFQELNRQCIALNDLVSPQKRFENKIQGFGDKICGHDLATAVVSRLSCGPTGETTKHGHNGLYSVWRSMSRHAQWTSVTTATVNNAMALLLDDGFSADDILDNCQLVLYNCDTIKKTLNMIRRNTKKDNIQGSSDSSDSDDQRPQVLISLPEVDYKKMSNSQVLSMALYLIEKNHYFTGNGVWDDQTQKGKDVS